MSIVQDNEGALGKIVSIEKDVEIIRKKVRRWYRDHETEQSKIESTEQDNEEFTNGEVQAWRNGKN